MIPVDLQNQAQSPLSGIQGQPQPIPFLTCHSFHLSQMGLLTMGPTNVLTSLPFLIPDTPLKVQVEFQSTSSKNAV